MNGQNQGFAHANETLARVVAYLSPYLFWGTVSVLTASIWLLG